MLNATDQVRIVVNPAVVVLPPPLALGRDPESGNLLLQFPAAAGRSYSVRRRESLTDGPWTGVETIPAGNSRAVVIPIPPTAAEQYYQVVIP